MKRGLLIALVILVLSGCTIGETSVERAVNLRKRIQTGRGCKFDATVTVDYSDHLCSFRMHCQTDDLGNLTFTVLAPETIFGISGTISKDNGKLTFDDHVLAFELISEDKISPVSAPWLFMKILCGGYIKACSEDSGGMYVQIDDSYADGAMLLEMWTDHNDIPYRCELIWSGRRVVSMDVENFTIL